MPLAELHLGIHLAENPFGNQFRHGLAPAEAGQIHIEPNRRCHADSVLLHHLIFALPRQRVFANLPDTLQTVGASAVDVKRSFSVVEVVVVILNVKCRLGLNRLLVPYDNAIFNLIHRLAIEFQHAPEAVEVEVEGAGCPRDVDGR